MHALEGGKPHKFSGNNFKEFKEGSPPCVSERQNILPWKYSTWKDVYIQEADMNGKLKAQNGKRRKRAAGLDVSEALLPSSFFTLNKGPERSTPTKPGLSTKTRRFARSSSLPVSWQLARLDGNEVSMRFADLERSPRYHSEEIIAFTEDVNHLLIDENNPADSFEDEGKVVHAKRIIPNAARRKESQSRGKYVLTSTLKEEGTSNAHGNACENKDVKDCQNARKKSDNGWGQHWRSPAASLLPNFSPPKTGNKPLNVPWPASSADEMKPQGGIRPRNTLSGGANGLDLTNLRQGTKKVFNLRESEYNPNKRQKTGNASISSSNSDEDVVVTGHNDTKSQTQRGPSTARSIQSLSSPRAKQECLVKEYNAVESILKPPKPANRPSSAKRYSSQNSLNNHTSQGSSNKALSISNPKRTINGDSVVRIGSQTLDDPNDPIDDDQSPSDGTLFSKSQKPWMSNNVRVVLHSPPKAESNGTANLREAQAVPDRLLTHKSNARLGPPTGLQRTSRELRTVSNSHIRFDDSPDGLSNGYENDNESKELAVSLLAQHRNTQHSSVPERGGSVTSNTFEENSEDELQANADIRPTIFDAPKQNPKSKQPLRKQLSGCHSFSVVQAFSQKRNYVVKEDIHIDATLTYDTGSKALKLCYTGGEVNLGATLEKLEFSKNGTKIVIHNSRNMRTQDGAHQIYLEFGTPKERKAFVGVVDHLVTLLVKDDDYLDKVYRTQLKRQLSQKQGRPPLAEEAEDIEFIKAKSAKKTRARLDEALEKKNGGRHARRLIDELQQDQQEISRTDTSNVRRQTRSSSGVFEVLDPSSSIPAERFYSKDSGSPSGIQPEKRSSARAAARRKSPEEEAPPGWTTLNVDWQSKWKGSIAYPPTGRNRAQVEMHDIERLDEGEFLNDSLINFYMTWLEQHLKPEDAKRIYFHNTFFYKALTTGKAGEEKGIKYKNVERWTAKVDLFSYDYIVVPVNEHAHWYVAIICNARKLLGTESESFQTVTQSSSPEKGVLILTPEASRPSSPSRKQDQGSVSDLGDELGESLKLVSPQIAATCTLSAGSASPTHNTQSTPSKEKAAHGAVDEQIKTGSDRRTPLPISDSLDQALVGPVKTAAETIDVDAVDTVDAAQASAKKAAQPKKGKRKSVARKYDPSDTRIITLDSLELSHSPTCVNLRDYLVKEIQSKKNIDIPQPGPLGMTASNIPKQLNHCDCGIFLLSYVEKFLEDPDNFVENISLAKRMEFENAPELREKIRKILFDLSQDQKTESKAESRQKKTASKKVIAKDQKPKPLAKLAVQSALANTSVTSDHPKLKKNPPEQQVPAAEPGHLGQTLLHSRKRSASSDIINSETAKRLCKQADSLPVAQNSIPIPRTAFSIVDNIDGDRVKASDPPKTNQVKQSSPTHELSSPIHSENDTYNESERVVGVRRIAPFTQTGRKRHLEIGETPEPQITTKPSHQLNEHSLRSHESSPKHQEHGGSLRQGPRNKQQHTSTSGSDHGRPGGASRPTSSSSGSTLTNGKQDDMEMLLPNTPFAVKQSKSSNEPSDRTPTPAPTGHAHPARPTKQNTLPAQRISPRSRTQDQQTTLAKPCPPHRPQINHAGAVDRPGVHGMERVVIDLS